MIEINCTEMEFLNIHQLTPTTTIKTAFRGGLNWGIALLGCSNTQANGCAPIREYDIYSVCTHHAYFTGSTAPLKEQDLQTQGLRYYISYDLQVIGRG